MLGHAVAESCLMLHPRIANSHHRYLSNRDGEGNITHVREYSWKVGTSRTSSCAIEMSALFAHER